MAFVGKLSDWHQGWNLRYQDWNRAKYLSDFERWLNRSFAVRRNPGPAIDQLRDQEAP